MHISMRCCCTKTAYTKADGRPAPPPTAVEVNWIWLNTVCWACTLHMLVFQVIREIWPDLVWQIEWYQRFFLLEVYPLLILFSMLWAAGRYVADLHAERDELAEQALYLTKVDHSLHVIGGDSEEDV